MKHIKTRFLLTLISLILLAGISAYADEYNYYFGNTHAHSLFSDGKDPAAEHFPKAKAAGYDFYALTDHALAKYKGYTLKNYETTKRLVDQHTDSKFVAIRGFEFSENDGPGGVGHLNVLNSATTLDATGRKVNLPVFYSWLARQPANVAASFNHPTGKNCNDFAYLTPRRRDALTMFEVINGGRLHYGSFLKALEKGWRVAPIASLDCHRTQPIASAQQRTGVLAPSLTRENIIEAMRARRVYCTWDKNLQLTFRANGMVMGSVLADPTDIACSVKVNDPDVRNDKDRVTRIEIVGDNGKVLRSQDFSAHTASWETTLEPTQKYYFVLVHCADKSDGPTAYSAPIWIEHQPAKATE